MRTGSILGPQNEFFPSLLSPARAALKGGATFKLAQYPTSEQPENYHNSDESKRNDPPAYNSQFPRIDIAILRPMDYYS